MTQVSDDSNIRVAPAVRNGNQMYHSVGLGAMNLHGYLAKNKIMYGSPESLEIVDLYYLLLNYWTLVESNNISIERGETFFEFEKSTYATGEYFDHYLETDYTPKLPRVAELFAHIPIPKIQ